MSHKSGRWLLGSLFLIVPAVLLVADTTRGRAQQAGNATANGPENVNVRYARVALKVAEFDLQQAIKTNERVSGTFSPLALQRLQNQVAIAQSRLENSLDHGSQDLHGVHLREVEGHLKLAELNLQIGSSLRERGSLPAEDLERLQMVVEVQRLAVERARSVDATKSSADHLQWQIDEMRQQMVPLQVRLERLETLVRQ